MQLDLKSKYRYDNGKRKVLCESVNKFCKRALDGESMPKEWKTKHAEGMLLELALKIVERALENRIRGLVRIDETQFGFMPGKSTAHAQRWKPKPKNPVLKEMFEAQTKTDTYSAKFLKT